MQICDGGEYLSSFYEVGDEIVLHRSIDELIEKVAFYLANPEERERIARNGYRKAIADHRVGHRLAELFALLRPALAQRRG